MTDHDKPKKQLVAELAEVCQQVAELEAAAAERQSLEEALRESEAEYRALVEQIPAIAYTAALDEGSTTLYVNPQIEKLLGITRAEWAGDPDFWRKGLHPDDRERVLAELHRSHKSGEPFRSEYRMLARDGRVVWFRDEAAIVRDDAGNPLVLQGAMLDITGRKQVEEELETYREHLEELVAERTAALTKANEQLQQEIAERRRTEELLRKINQAYKALSDCNQVVMRATDELELLQEVCRIIVEDCGYRLVWIGFAEHDEAKTVRPAAQAGYEEGYLGTVNITWADTERGRGPTGTAIRTGRPAVNRDILTNPDYAPWRAEALKREYASSAALPLLTSKEGVIGALNVYATQSDAFAAEEIDLLMQLAGDLAYGVLSLRTWMERVRTEEAFRESEELHRITMENILDPVFITDDDGQFTFICANVPHILGYSMEEMQTMGNISKLVGDRLFDLEELETRGEIHNIEKLIANKHGRERTFLVAVKRVAIKEGTILYTCHDITERKQVEEALRESEEKWRLLYEDLPGGSFAVNDQYVIENANDFLCTLTGYTKEELLGQVCDIICPKGPHKCPIFDLGKERIDNDETAVKAKGGQFIPVIKSARKIPIGGKEVIVENFQDITERKRAEAEREYLLTQIREQARQVRQIVNTVPEGVLLLDADARILLANPAAQESLTVLGDAQVGDTLAHLGSRPLTELLTSPPQGLWHEVSTKEPIPRIFELATQPMETHLKNEGWVMVIRDVTQERQIQQRAQQQERLAAVGQLAAGIAHDFNNIMAVIVLYAQMALRAPTLSRTVEERLRTITQQATRATDLIQQILDFSRRAVLERQPMDLVPFFKEQIKLLERTLPENIRVELFHGSDAYTVNADPTRIQQAIMNLALNARDAMPDGGDLHIGLERMRIQDRKDAPLPEMEPGEWIQVTVTDTGTGIPSYILPHIFEPFFTTKAPLGSGLGLAQVHGIVKQHEGEVDVLTQLGKGTTFILYLPALPVTSMAAPTSETLVLPQGQGETILVVEDDQITRGALADSLELLNYQVLVAANGREALAVFEQHSEAIALVLTDVVMPEMGGIALLNALLQKDPTVRVVMLTGHPLEEELDHLRAQGLRDWLPKPPNLEQLAQVVAQALGRKAK